MKNSDKENLWTKNYGRLVNLVARNIGQMQYTERERERE